MAERIPTYQNYMNFYVKQINFTHHKPALAIKKRRRIFADVTRLIIRPSFSRTGQLIMCFS